MIGLIADAVCGAEGVNHKNEITLHTCLIDSIFAKAKAVPRSVYTIFSDHKALPAKSHVFLLCLRRDVYYS